MAALVIVVVLPSLTNAMEPEVPNNSQNSESKSLMPDETFSNVRGEWGLLNPTRANLDDELRKLCATFLSMPENERVQFRKSISLDQKYTLLEFARRSAVFALRDKNEEIFRDGLISIAMVETDYRDILVALAILHHTALRLEKDPHMEFEKAAEAASPRTANLITGFAKRDRQSQKLKESWGFTEVKIGKEVGFASWGFRKYEPETDLLQIATQIAPVIEEDSYSVDNIELATTLPPVWLKRPESNEHLPILDKTTGGVTIRGRLDRDKHPSPSSQMFVLFMIELDSSDSAKTLLKISREKVLKDHSAIGFAAGRVFALLVARSTVMGTEPFESMESLSRFREPIDQILKDTNGR